MITDEELDGLPGDSELAFVALEQILRTKVENVEAEARNNDFDPDPARFEYMTRVVAAARHYEIEALGGLEVPRGTRGVAEHYHQFRNDIDFVTMQIRIGAARQRREGAVQLDATMKRKLHHHVQQIRDLIEAAELTPEKKDDLLSKLNKLAAEIDRSRTRLQAGMDFYIAVCAGVGEGFKKLKPVQNMIDSIGAVLGQAKAIEDSITKQLPRERKRLEPPKRQLPPPSQRRPESGLDDDIPF